MLRAGKIRLRFEVRASASTFCIPKKTPGRFREVWNGHDISEKAGRPPKPRHLGNPASLGRVRVRPDSTLYLSKRDATTFFDQLSLPRCLRPFLGRPSVRAGALADALGVDLESLRSYVDDERDGPLSLDTVLVPVMCTWPMGFSWSSYVAQEVMLAVCDAAGIDEAAILDMGCLVPADVVDWCTVATDDIILLDTNAECARTRLAAIDAAFDATGVRRNRDKDVDAEEEGEALGCYVSSTHHGLPP